jgi:hypothetical protein
LIAAAIISYDKGRLKSKFRDVQNVKYSHVLNSLVLRAVIIVIFVSMELIVIKFFNKCACIMISKVFFIEKC